MIMSSKDIIIYEFALKIKNLGFDEPCIGNYRKVQVTDAKTGDSSESTVYLDMMTFTMNFNENNKDTDASALTFSQAFRFFREKFNLFSCVELHLNFPIRYYFIIDEIGNDDFVYHTEDETIFYDKYEDAEIACLKLLIKINS